MFRRIKLIVVVVAAMAVMVTASVAPAMAQGTPKADENAIAGQLKATENKEKIKLPDTSGPSVLVPISAMLLVGSGILGYSVLRRR